MSQNNQSPADAKETIIRFTDEELLAHKSLSELGELNDIELERRGKLLGLPETELVDYGDGLYGVTQQYHKFKKVMVVGAVA